MRNVGHLWKSYASRGGRFHTRQFLSRRIAFNNVSTNPHLPALCHSRHFRYSRSWQAGGAFLMSLSLFDFWQNKEKSTAEDRLKRLVYEAKKAQKDGDLLKSEKFFHEALSLIKQRHQEKEIDDDDHLQARTYIFDCLANLAFSQREFNKAERLYKETIKGCVQAGMHHTGNVIIEISLKLANIYAIQNRPEEAVTGFEFCINAQKEKSESSEEEFDKDTEALLGMSLDSYGRYLLHLGNYNKAEEMLKDSYKIALKCLGENHRQTLVIMINLAVAKIFKKDYSVAENLLLKAIKVGTEIDAEELPALYCNLGAIYLARQQMTEAYDACVKAMEMAKKYKDNFAVKKAKICLDKVTGSHKEKLKITEQKKS